MRKSRSYRRLAKKGYAIPFAPDDPNSPANRPRTHRPHVEQNLGRCRDLLQSKRVAEGLQRLNGLAAATNSPKQKAQIIALTGDSEYRQGHFENAINAYRAALQMVTNDPRAWVRPALAEVRALLKAALVDQAYVSATQVWNRSFAQHEELQRQFAIQQAHIQHKRILIKQRPYRASVVASRLGYLFLNEGEPAHAKELFTRAITVNPQGGSRARHGLALIALAENNLAEAESRAREALLLGKFQGKTVGVWATLIAARQRAGKLGVDADLLAGVQSSRSSTVRSRSTLAIVRELRSFHDPAWENIASQWITAEGAIHPTIATEIRKLLNAKLRLAADDPLGQANKAGQLLSSPELLSRSEYIAAAKQFVRASLTAQQNVDLNSIIQRAVTLYGNSARDRLAHHLALACMMAPRHDLARALLQGVLGGSSRNAQFAKSLWALARMEAVLKNHSAAADLYDRFANESAIPLRYRLQARIKWLHSVIEAGRVADVAQVTGALIALTNGITDFDLLLDFARQLRQGAHGLRDLANSLFARGEALAQAQFAAATNPSTALGILFRLTRRQVYDFGKYQNAVALWNSLTAQQRDWLWSPKAEFWEYLSWIFVAMTRAGLFSQAEQLVATYLNDSATPLEGRLAMMAASAAWKIRKRKIAEGVTIFRAMIKLAPSNRLCAEGYYWLALIAKKNGDQTGCAEYAARIQMALGSQIGLLTEWQLDCKASLLRSNLVPETALSAKYNPDFQAKCLAEIQADVNKV